MFRKLVICMLFLSLSLSFNDLVLASNGDQGSNPGFFQTILNFVLTPFKNFKLPQPTPTTQPPKQPGQAPSKESVLGAAADTIDALNTKTSSLEDSIASLKLNSLKANNLLAGTIFTDIVGNSIIDTSGNIYPKDGNPSLGTADKKFGSLNLSGFQVTTGGDTTNNGSLTVSGATNLKGDINFNGQAATDLLPKDDNKYALGSSSKKFSSGYFNSFNVSSVNGLTITSSTGTFTISNGKTLTVNNTLTLSGTDGTTFSFPGASDTVVTLSASQTLTNKTINASSNTISNLTNTNLSGSAGITNANLANSSVTVTAGTGLSGGGAVSLGSS